jgi:hypothetical protein
MRMPPPTGEHVLDALLLLGHPVEITEGGAIAATGGMRTVHGRASQRASEWADRSATFHVLEQAHIAKWRKRIDESHPPGRSNERLIDE